MTIRRSMMLAVTGAALVGGVATAGCSSISPPTFPEEARAPEPRDTTGFIVPMPPMSR